jgi:hypothetical protein
MDRSVRFATRVVLAAAFAGGVAFFAGRQATAQTAQPATVARFEVSNGAPAESFVIELRDPARIAQARALLTGTGVPTHVNGRVVREPVAYNPRWHFHLDPASIVFSEVSITGCDWAASYVEAHLAELDRFLFNARWCPITSHLVRELPVTATPSQ